MERDPHIYQYIVRRPKESSSQSGRRLTKTKVMVMLDEMTKDELVEALMETIDLVELMAADYDVRPQPKGLAAYERWVDGDKFDAEDEGVTAP